MYVRAEFAYSITKLGLAKNLPTSSLNWDSLRLTPITHLQPTANVTVYTKACLNITQEAGVACRGLWCVCGWKDVGMVIRKSIAVWFLTCLVTFLRFHPYMFFLSFF